MNPLAIWKAAKIAAKLAAIALRERQRRTFKKWNQRKGKDNGENTSV